jgi:Cys-rich repeat protein
MSAPLTFTLVSSVSGLNTNYTLQFLYNQPTNQVRLGISPSFGQTAFFNITGLPPFLQTNNGLYLGQSYTPQLQIGNQTFFLEQVSGTSTYNLVSSPTLRCFAIIPQNTNSLAVNISNFQENNSFTMISNGSPITIYSPIQCMDTCSNCGSDICPDLFTCINGQCATNLPINAAFGIRLMNGSNQYVYTYSIVGNSLITHIVNPLQISASTENSNMFKERWFFADYSPGKTQLIANQTYPLYTFMNGQKYYIANPAGGTYQLISVKNSSNNLLALKPTRPINWRNFSLDPSQFINLYLPPNLTSSMIALWQNPNVGSQPAVISPSLSATNCTSDPQCTGGQVCISGQCVDCTSNSQCTTGQICNNGKCQAPSCTSNVQCSGGQICLNGQCINCTSNSQCTGGLACISGTCQACTSNTQCAAGQTCVNGKCQTPVCTSNAQCSGGQACIGGSCQACTSAAQCAAGQICNNGKCQAPSCTSNAQCSGGQVCSNGMCQVCTADSQCTGAQTCQNGACKNPPSIPFWKTWWFWLIIILFVLLVIGIIIWLALSSRKKVPIRKTSTTTTTPTSQVHTWINICEE